MKSLRFPLLCLIALALVLGLSAAFTAPADASTGETCGEATTVILWAGQHHESGTVTASNDETNLYVTFTATGDWRIAQTHVHVATSLDQIPQRNGNPIPGQFAYRTTHNPTVTSFTYTIPLNSWAPGTQLYIAAHAVVQRVTPDGTVIQSETGWAGEENFPGRNWARYFTYTVQECIEEPTPGQGCTPGYWRQEHHYDSWVGYSPSDAFDVVFEREVSTRSIITLGDAVQLSGGGLDALMRHSVAALLNAANSDVNYPYTQAEVISMFQAAFDSGEYEATKDLFDAANNLGCPLN